MTATAPGAVTMTGAQFHRLLAAVLPCAARDDVLRHLNAVHLETGPHGIYAAATDRYTFAVARHPDPAPARRRAQITIPRSATVAMLRMVRRRDPLAIVRITGRYLSLRTAAGTACRTPAVYDDGVDEFPDWRQVFRRLLANPEQPGQPVHLNPAYLARFAPATDATGLRITVCRPPHARRCHALVMTAGDWFLGAVMSLTNDENAARADSPGAAWHADLSPVRAA